MAAIKEAIADAEKFRQFIDHWPAPDDDELRSRRWLPLLIWSTIALLVVAVFVLAALRPEIQVVVH